jgi:integrase
MARKQVQRRDGIYTRKDRGGYWASWVDATGRRRQRKLAAHTLQQAQAALAAERLRVEEHIKFGKPLPTEDTFEAFADEFLKFQERRIATQVVKGKLSKQEYARQKGIVEQHLKPYFREMRLAAIRRKDVVDYIHARTGAVSDGTIIKEVNVLKRLFNVAVDRELIGANPAHRAPLPAAPEGRNRYLTPKELGTILKACPPWLQPIVGLAVTLGTRRGELLAVRLQDIDLKKGNILLRKTKNGKMRPAFINEPAAQVLAAMGVGATRKSSGLLFPGVTPAQVTVAFVRACEDAGIEDFSFHDLRHTYASHLRMNGADLHDLQKLLGHSDPRMTNRYAHLSNAHLETAARRLDGVFTLHAPTKQEGSNE